jgi:hypothetical protein
MRHVFVVVILAAACTEQPVASEPVRAPAAPLAPQEVRAPRERSIGVIAGIVIERSDLHEAKLESGGPNPIPLRLESSTKVTLDGKPAHMIDIREGQLVRAAYKMGAEGKPVAIQVVANSKPVTQVSAK